MEELDWELLRPGDRIEAIKNVYINMVSEGINIGDVLEKVKDVKFKDISKGNYYIFKQTIKNNKSFKLTPIGE